ncbi:hypothetical protein RPMA_12240 [Tardiphaga alba]|uniref:Uncharacterized protein n=1 Tax=Tardiphaga alba TaxID=340268 RepID=A0ABX8A883_9BRAD|nr:hypothetical protein [Tardiphaga alba]QUS39516.1 hypothetical protein RPMA_12240 [Tardiphaga alba]
MTEAQRYILSEQEVFDAFNDRRATRDGAWSGYIADEVRQRHAKAVRAGAVGQEPRRSLILRRLQGLAAKGLLARSDGTNGYYGYYWTLTPAGQACDGQVNKWRGTHHEPDRRNSCRFLAAAHAGGVGGGLLRRDQRRGLPPTRREGLPSPSRG